MDSLEQQSELKPNLTLEALGESKQHIGVRIENALLMELFRDRLRLSRT